MQRNSEEMRRIILEGKDNPEFYEVWDKLCRNMEENELIIDKRVISDKKNFIFKTKSWCAFPTVEYPLYQVIEKYKKYHN